MTDNQSTLAIVTSGAAGRVEPFPASFRTQHIPTNGTTLFVRIGGAGPAVLLLHGYGETGDMWAPLAAQLAPRYTVIVPDLRGMGLSVPPFRGENEQSQGRNTAGVWGTSRILPASCVP